MLKLQEKLKNKINIHKYDDNISIFHNICTIKGYTGHNMIRPQEVDKAYSCMSFTVIRFNSKTITEEIDLKPLSQ